MRARTLVVLALTVMMLVGNSGCLSVGSIRDALLFRRAEPDVSYWKVTPPPVDELWEADSVIPADTFASTNTFKVKEGARWIKLTYTVDLPSAVLGEQKIFNYTIYFEPLVTLRLRMPDNTVYWERNFTSSDGNAFTIQTPADGIWTLRMEAKGYGGELFGLEARDTLWVVVDIYEPK